MPMDRNEQPLVEGDEVQLRKGRATGVVLPSGVFAYCGVPYASPPLGDIRWKPPQPIEPWEGVRSLISRRQRCPEPGLSNPAKTSEDCLYLDIWTPSDFKERNLPVMVWLRGGGDGSRLAEGGAVVVSVSYRTGPLGFLAHPALSAESDNGVSGNYGLLDQIAALRWIQLNISALGGDPDRVTLFGESAGGVSICKLMVSPLARGLFHRAIMQSGGPLDIRYVLPWADGLLSESEEDGLALAAGLGHGSPDSVLARLRSLTTDELFRLTGTTLGPFNEGLRFGPVIDGWVLPKDSMALFSQGRHADVPVIVGFNADEGSIFAKDMDVETYRNWVHRMCPDSADELLDLFPVVKESDVRASFDKLYTAMVFAYPARYVARSMESKASPAWLYHFTRVPSGPAARNGASHGLDIPYVFGHLSKRAGFREPDHLLSAAIRQYWLTFANCGDPNSSGLPYWPPYDKDSDRYIEFGDEVIVKEGLYREACEAMELIGGDSV